MEIITSRGIEIGRFDQKLASVIGNSSGNEGARLLAQAVTLGRKRVEMSDWLFCLAKTPTTAVRENIVDPSGQRPEDFIDAVEAAVGHRTPANLPMPTRLTRSTVSDEVVKMLDEASLLAAREEGGLISERILTAALFKSISEDLRDVLALFIGSHEALQELQRRITPKKKVVFKLFRPDGTLDLTYLSSSATALLRRLREEAAGIRAKKVTTRHLLYSLLSNETNALCAALSVNGIDVKKELHAVLTRELSRPGKKRNEEFRLSPDTVFATVQHLFERAWTLADNVGNNKLKENHVALALVEMHPEEITRLLPPSKVLDMGVVRSYMADCMSDEEEDKVVAQYSIKEIERRMKEAIIGQETAIDRVLPWIKRLRFGLPREGRPAGVFLFMGPTGTGKTQLAKELARYVFGDDELIIFLEMGQFQTKESMNGFVGAPPGYVGYGEGLLTNGLRDKPESVVLFDEIEKAHTQVFDALLRFADEGLISDPAGPIRDGRRCILVMTTNAGQAWLREYLQTNPNAHESPEELTTLLFEEGMKELREKDFKPEFLGRVDECITFLPFTEDICYRIVDRVLNKELVNFRELKRIEIDVPTEVRKFLAKVAHERSGNEGARGAPRAVNRYIVTPVIDHLTEQDFPSDHQPVKLFASTLGTGVLTRVVFNSEESRQN